MPHRYYEHVCGAYGVRDLTWTPCHICGAPGVFVEWHWSGIEYMGKFRQLYGLPPIGPHHGFVSGLRIRECCAACAGRGLFDVEDGRKYQRCRACDGIGAHLTCSPEELQAVQQIAWALIRHFRSSPAVPGQAPLERLFARIPDQHLQSAAQRLLEEGRISDLHRVLVWQGIVAEEDEQAQRAFVEDDDDDDEIDSDEEDTAEDSPAHRSLAELLDLLDDLKERDLISD